MRFFSTLVSAFLISIFFIPANAQVTITLGSGTTTTSVKSTEPSPYCMVEVNQHMQFVYTASEITAAGGSAGEISSIAWKVDDLISSALPSYNIRMKNTKAKDVASHDGSDLKVVKRSYSYPVGKQGWQTTTLDSIFHWDGTSNILVDVCYGALSSTSAEGTVYIYNNTSNQRRGEFGKGSSCGSGTSSVFAYKPFVQFELDPECATPRNVTYKNLTSSSVDIIWDQALSGAQEYEYFLFNSSGSPSGTGTFTKDTSLSVKGLCPSKLHFFYVRSVCGKGDTSEWSKAMVFQTSAGGGVKTNSPVCEGDSLWLQVEQSQSYSWSGPNGFKSTDRSPLFEKSKTTQSGNYTVTIVDQNKCTVTYSASAQVDTVPVIDIYSNSPVCEESDLNIRAYGGDIYKWNGPNGFTSDSSVIVRAVALTSYTGTYNLEVENSFGCLSSTTVNMEVNELPVITVSKDTALCAQGDLSLVVIGNYSIEWTGPKSFKSSANNPVLSSISTDEAGSYKVTATTNKNCSVSEEVEVIVYELPDLLITGEDKVCENSDWSIEGSGAESYEWSFEGKSVSFKFNHDLSSTSKADAGEYTLIGMSDNGCVSEKTLKLEVLDIPVVNIDVPGGICEGEQLELKATTDGKTFLWTGPNGFSSANKVATRLAELTGAGKYVFVSKADNGCETETEQLIDVWPLPQVSIDKQGNNLVASKGLSNYEWYLDGNKIEGASGNLYTAASIGNYQVKSKSLKGCVGESDVVNVTNLSVHRSYESFAFRIYPNPTEDVFRLQSTHRIDHLAIFDLRGVLVQEFVDVDGREVFELDGLQLGNYYIVATSEAGVAHGHLGVK